MLEEFQCVPTNFRNSECVNFALILFWGSHVCNSHSFLLSREVTTKPVRVVVEAM